LTWPKSSRSGYYTHEMSGPACAPRSAAGRGALFRRLGAGQARTIVCVLPGRLAWNGPL